VILLGGAFFNVRSVPHPYQPPATKQCILNRSPQFPSYYSIGSSRVTIGVDLLCYTEKDVRIRSADRSIKSCKEI
jgi:hypothetical protein